MAAKDIVKYQFKKGQSGNPKGRPPNRVPDMLVQIFGSKRRAKQFYNLSSEEVDSWEKAVMAMTTPQLSLLAKWEDTPVYPRGLAISIISDMKNGHTKTLDKLRNQQYEAKPQAIDITSKGQQITNAPLVVEIIDNREQVEQTDEEQQADAGTEQQGEE